MPFRRTYRRRTYRRRPQNKGGVRRVVRREAKKAIAKEIETKASDVSLAASSVDYTTGVVQALHANLTPGTGANQYIGTRIHPVYLHIRYKVHAGDPQNLLRVIIIQTRTAGVPTLANTLESVSNVRAPLSDYEVDYNHTYTVLYNRIHTLDDANFNTQLGEVKIRMKRLRAMYYTAGAAIERGGLYFLCISDSAIATHPTVEFYSRLHYKDA